MAYKKYYKNLKMENYNVTLEATCYWQSTAHGFHHCVENMIIKNKRNNETYSIYNKTFARYLNRTWECYEFQFVIQQALRKLQELYKLKNDDFIIEASKSLIQHYRGY